MPHREDALIELYFAPTPNGWKATIFMEEAGLDFKLCVVNLSKGEQHSASFLKISPNNRMPAIVDRTVSPPVTVFESGAIMAYLCDTQAKCRRLLPTEPRARSSVLQWVFWQTGNQGPMAGQLSHFVNYAPHVDPNADHSYAENRYRNEFDHCFEVMERQLSQTQFLGGDSYSIADIICWPWCLSYKKFKIDMDAYPGVRRWYLDVKQRKGTSDGMKFGLEQAKKPLGKGNLMSESDKQTLFKQTGRSAASKL